MSGNYRRGRPPKTTHIAIRSRLSPKKRPTAANERITVSTNRVTSISADGRRMQQTVHHIEKRRRIIPSQLEDDYAGFFPDVLYTFGANPSDGVQVSVGGVTVETSFQPIGIRSSSGMGAARGSDSNSEDEDDEDDDDVVSGQKRKRYQSSDEPMTKWRPKAQEYLSELFGVDAGPTVCMECVEPLVNEEGAVPNVLFRCIDCENLVSCHECLLKMHSRLPLHRIQKWNGSFWENTTLRDQGLIYQLGHQGLQCPAPHHLTRELVVIDVSDIHKISFRDCGCQPFSSMKRYQQLMRNGWYPATHTNPQSCATFRTLDLFRTLYVVANVNVTDFIRSIERNADGSGMSKRPERIKAFMRMTRQYSFLKRAKRSGRGHDVSGVDGTKQGELAVRCWACPHDGLNLPPGWQTVDPKYMFLYVLYLAVDANFRLKNKMRANERDAVELGPGFGFFVNQKEYKDHIRNYVDEQDISTCSAFAALSQKDTRNTSGLRVSGVGAVFCARHGVCRPRGMGDLQKGERYSNMDFIFASACILEAILAIFVAYDIFCQWILHLWSRMHERLPANYHLNKSAVTISGGLPVWHADGHIQSCREVHVVTHQPGAGAADYEESEREWSILNPASYATREMGEESRRNFLEDKLDYMAYAKNVGQVDSLPRKLFIAKEERAIQMDNFKELQDSLPQSTRAAWTKMLSDWNGDRSKPNPYLVRGKEATLNQHKALEELTREELEETRLGRSVQRAVSAVGFLSMALAIEDTQRRVRRDAKTKNVDAPSKVVKIDDRRQALHKRIKRLRGVQDVFTPGATLLADEDERKRRSGGAEVLEENIKLWLPSEMEPTLRSTGCIAGVAEKERNLRDAQAADALDMVRKSLLVKSRAIRFRNANVTGQNDGRRSNTLITGLTSKVFLQADKYRVAREAYIRLGGDSHKWRELSDADLTMNITVTDDTDSRRRMAAAVTAELRPTRTSSTRTTVSWIWAAEGLPEDDSDEMHELVRVEWAKSKARRDRWCEEVELLNEEMRRVLRYLKKYAAVWTDRAKCVDTGAHVEGRRAYALKQAHLYSEREGMLFKKWSGKMKVGKEKILPAGSAVLEENQRSGLLDLPADDSA